MDYNKKKFIQHLGAKFRVKCTRNRLAKKSNSELKFMKGHILNCIAKKDFLYIHLFQLNIINSLLKNK